MRERLPSLVVGGLVALYLVTFSAISIRQHDAFLTHKEDLGQIDQAVWNSLHGRLLVETDEDHQSTRLTDHVEPSLVLSSAVFLLWDDVRALLVWQALIMALGAWPIFLLAREVLSSPHPRPLPRSELQRTGEGSTLLPLSRRSSIRRGRGSGGGGWPAVIFALIYLMFPALEAAHLAEFHAAPLAVVPIAFALLFLERQQWRRFFVAILFVIAIKEEMALIGFMLGIAALVVAAREKFTSSLPHVQGRARLGIRWATLIVLISLAWFVLATFVIVPHFGAAKYRTGGDSVYFQRFGELGTTPAVLVRTLLTNPGLVLRVVLSPERLGYLGGLLASVGFLALAAPWVLLLSLPLLMANLLSNFPAQYSGDFHYSAPLVPFFVVAALYGLRRVVDRRVVWFLLIWLLIGASIYHYLRGYSPLSENFYWPGITAHHQRFARFAAQVPRDARVSLTPPLFPHLSHREMIYDFPVIADADYLLLDASGVTDMHPKDFFATVSGLLSGGQFGIIDSADGYILLMRGAPSTPLPDAFFDFVRAPDVQPQYRADIVFGDALKLIGYDVIVDVRWHQVSMRLYWQALRPLETDLRLYPFYHDEHGNVIEDTSQRPMVATVWYPPQRWPVGETIQTQTIAWDVGRSFAIAVGAMHGSDWDRKGRRLATSTGETQVELGTYAWDAEGKHLMRVGR